MNDNFNTTITADEEETLFQLLLKFQVAMEKQDENDYSEVSESQINILDKMNEISEEYGKLV
jgi:hypothetical protein